MDKKNPPKSPTLFL